MKEQGIDTLDNSSVIIARERADRPIEDISNKDQLVKVNIFY